MRSVSSLRRHADAAFNLAKPAIEFAKRAVLRDSLVKTGVVKLFELIVEVLGHFLGLAVDVFEDRLELDMHDLVMLGECVLIGRKCLLQSREVLLVLTDPTLQRLDAPPGRAGIICHRAKLLEYERDIGLRNGGGIVLSGFRHGKGRVKDNGLRLQPKPHADLAVLRPYPQSECDRSAWLLENMIESMV